MGAKILCELFKVQDSILVGVPGLDKLKDRDDQFLECMGLLR